ncbi:molybdopterin molybdotransferase MoeA [Nitrosophilus kaiyonis]|uniref:molybdopterin molybdotransferase MoeA n=1 Tax=Nitrosophilus kaiyonis TaxID=2930200 RepID=UPI002493B6B1|nr:molybdopterin molybdotransferase MoeA [Nitrosophilus kaiyonis]
MKVTINEALKIIKNQKFLKRIEVLPIEFVKKRVCAKDYYANFNLPRFDNSAMDGYAIKIDDAGKEVEVIKTVLAGEICEIEVKNGFAIKIMTGAKIPKGTEAIVPFEDVQIIKENKILLPKNIKKYANIRFSGEDIKKDELIIKEGDILDGYKIGVLASQGYSHIEVFKKVKVGIFATGKELKLHFEKIKPHQIYNSNTPTFLTRAKELGCEVTFLGRCDDNKESIKELILSSLDQDLIITSGGVSVGEADFTKESFLELGGEIFFDKVEIKPGKPTTFGKIQNSFFLNLPGNPLAAALNFEIFGRFIINLLSHKNRVFQNFILCKLSLDLKNKPGRNVVIPGFFDGEYFTPSKKRGPGMVSPLSESNGYIILDKDVEVLKKDRFVKFIPIKFDFFTDKLKDFYTYSE